MLLSRSKGLLTSQIVIEESGLETISIMAFGTLFPRGSRYLSIQELGLKDHIYYGRWGLNP